MNQRHQNLVQMNKDQVARRASQRAAVEASTNETLIMDGVSDLLEPVIGMNEGQPDQVDADESELDEESEEIPPGTFAEEESDDEEAELSWMDFVGVAIGQIDSEPEDLDLPLSSPLFRREEAKIKKIRPDNSTWYPFLNKEYLIGSLLIGYLHKLISRDMYHLIRSVFTVCDVRLPRWEALRMMRANIRTLINRTIVEKETVFGQPVFGLNASELISDVSKTYLMLSVSENHLS
ncbi:hypothetical protein PGT21_007160 [Puccinia graminis f. sp. tritici]|uniref:PiggyBac transposable element-derived protein domain-containing protein n=1 Tax=Puccinia graminis f. sp. tritici TaxID=56615 RepID=A0A5B0MGT1_PUCGR|nr:hypothetical protein PGT21_007160 [Puccinia graminis f. sp. tritici]